MTDPIADFLSEVDAELGEPAPPAEPPQEAEVEEVVEEAPEPEPEPEKILGRFKSQEDLAKSYQELEDKFKERDDEIGQLRQIAQQQWALQQQQASQPPDIPLNSDTVDWFDEQVEQNPYGAAEWARANDRSGVLYNRAMDSWYEIQPRHAAAYERQLEMGQMAQAVDQRLQMMDFRSQTAALPILAQQQREEFTEAWGQAQQRLPDLADHSEAILEAAQAAPEVLSLLQTGNAEDKQRVIENLYYLAKGKQAISLNQAAQDMAAQQAQETQTAKADSFVAPSGSRNETSNSSNVEKWLTEIFDPAAEQYYGSS